ncbi:MAG: polyprenyl synthetase family protein [Deltaproteobacteria bacterium]|nr:polyprenyl synthetase family protein [Deltaproteobacteria bacterium]
MTNRCDVLIVGAGPAGSEAAYRFSELGFKVVVLEKKSLTREKPCGGGIGSGELLEFGMPPESVIERRVDTLRIFGPRDSELTISTEVENSGGIIVKRSVYDAWLQQRASKARFIAHAAIKQVGRESGRWTLRVETPTGEFLLAAPLLIHAAGSGAFTFERMLGLRPGPLQKVGLALQVWLDFGQPCLDRVFGGSIELHFLFSGGADGYFWLFPKREVLVAGVAVSVSVLRKDHYSLRKELDGFLERRLAELGLENVGKRLFTDGGKVPMGCGRPLSGEGLMLIGDAAGVCSPIHGGGIYQGRKTAFFAAEAGSRFLRGDAAALQQYQEQVLNHFEVNERKWERPVKNVIFDPGLLPMVLAQGKRDSALREALGIIFSSSPSQQKAYETLERSIFPILAGELDELIAPERGEIDAALKKLFNEDSELHHVVNFALLGKGKRLRPALVLLGGRTLGARTGDLLPTALAYELAETASLIHDDIIDGAEIRRGQASLHKQFGDAKAITAGDALIMKSFEMLTSYQESRRIDKACLIRLLRLGCLSGLATADGEIRDIDFRPAQARSTLLEDYLELVRRKTGALFSAATEAGAIVAGAPEATIAALRSLGMNLGIAFQIYDDAKDLLAPVSSSLKSRYTDIKEGKLTAPLACTARHATESDLARLISLLSRNSVEVAGEVLEIYQKYAALDSCRRLAQEYLDQAAQDLEVLPVSADRDKLAEIIRIFGYWSRLTAAPG